MKSILFALVLSVCLVACDTVTSEVEPANVEVTYNKEDCKTSSGLTGTRYFRMVNGHEYEISEGAFQCLCTNQCTD